MADLTCPFCGDTGYDAPGLANHYRMAYCDKYVEALAAYDEEDRQRRERYGPRRFGQWLSP